MITKIKFNLGIVKRSFSWCVVGLLVLINLTSCREKSGIDNETIPDIAANPEVAKRLESFEGRGALTDDSKPTPAKEAIKNFKVADDLDMDLILSEPEITQPLEISFDTRGRLWVVQYNQYPYPQGVKVTGLDNHLRLKFDHPPAPPPLGPKGADKITMFEDTTGDGIFDHSVDVISGLNITTSVLSGRGKIWVLSPPYLLAYPDMDGDGFPDGDPEVCLEGFGLEDTHAVASNMRWGPDGWIYGAQGSTTTANVSSEKSKNVAFEGQAIWRYHPDTKIFEIFAEGGGNTFNVEIDSKGRIFAGNNGYGRGPYFKQGAYYSKSWGKHGPLTNPYAYGYLENMPLEGEKIRFTQTLIRYEAGNLPSRYQGKFIAPNSLQGNIILTDIEPNGSSFKTIDEEIIINTEDRWFRPVDIQTGPDGGVYVADWYDSRLSHVDPRDTWDKTTGRIYRLRKKDSEVDHKSFDLTKYSNSKLIELLRNDNRWFRQKAQQVIADRGDESIIPKLKTILENETGQIALEALWAIHGINHLDDEITVQALRHTDPYVRMWAVRLSGDKNTVSPKVGAELIALSDNENNVEVRSQLAATAKRLSSNVALPIVKNLLVRYNDSKDPDIPLQIWWAIESKVGKADKEIIDLFKNRGVWDRPVVKETILQRLIMRYIQEEGIKNYHTATALFLSTPNNEFGEILMNGLQEGLRGRSYDDLPDALVEAIAPYRASGEGEWAKALRKGDENALQEALKVVENAEGDLHERRSYIEILGTGDYEESIPILLKIIGRPVQSESKTIKIAALTALQRYDNADIGDGVLIAYPNVLREDMDLRLASLNLLVSRSQWAMDLLDEIQKTMIIHSEDVPIELANKLKLLRNDEINERVMSIWPETERMSSQEKTKQIEELSALIKKGKGDLFSGEKLYRSLCGACHRLFGEGGDIGPDLTGYDRRNIGDLLVNIVDPNADIREGYVTYKIKTKDGRILSGFLTSRSENGITLLPYGGEKISFSMDEIENMEAHEESLMPEGLLNNLSDQEVQDLFAYIMKEI